MEKASILIIDDDEYIRLSLQMLLEESFEEVDILEDPSKIPSYFNQKTYDLVLLDMNFKQGDTTGKEGIYWLELIRKISENTSVVIITAYGEVEQAVYALKTGAVDFLNKPWQNEKLMATVTSAIKLSREKGKVENLEKKQRTLLEKNSPESQFIWGHSQSMKKIKNLIEKVALTEANILITGENGTGKEMVARKIHELSVRKGEVFLPIDLGSIKDTLFESEMFGHKKGAFTDAREDRMGKMEAASGGTLFLDEIGNMAPGQQVKLLTAIQRKVVSPVGSNRDILIDVRLICATNIDLVNAVAEGNFREDLLYRINTIEINVPPLRQRLDDIPLLADFFLNKFTEKYNKTDLTISTSCMSGLQDYPWPGNIREFEHAMERAVILAENKLLELDDFHLQAHTQHDIQIKDYNLESLEAWAIKKSLEKHLGNVSQAADELGLSRGALYRRMEKYNL